MAEIYTQTDTAADSGFNVGSSGLTAGDVTLSSEIIEGGTAGSTETVVDTATAGTDRAVVAFQTDNASPYPPETTTWNSGDYVVRINITTSRANLQWASTHIMARTSGGSYTTVASLSGQSIGLDTTGTKTMTVNRATDYTANLTDTLYIVCGFTHNSPHGNSTVGVTPSLNIDTPIIISQTVSDSHTFTVNMDQTEANTKSISEAITYLTNLAEVNNIGFDETLNLILDVAQQESSTKTIPLSLNLDNTLNYLIQNIMVANKTITYDTLMNEIFDNNKSTQESVILGLQMDENQFTSVAGSVAFGLSSTYLIDNNKATSEQFSASVILDQAEQVSKLLTETQSFSFTLSTDVTPFGVQIFDDPVYSAGNYIFVDLSNILASEGTVKSGSITFTNQLGQQQTVGLIGQAAAQLALQVSQLQSVTKTTTESQSFDILNDLALSTTQLLNFTATLNLDQLQTSQINAIKSIFYNLQLAQDQVNVKTTDKSLTFTSNLDINLVNTLLANTSISFDVTLDQLNTAGKDIAEAITFLSNLDFDAVGNVTVTVPFNLQMSQTQQVTGTLASTINLINNLSTTFEKQMVADKAITYLTQLQFTIGSLEGIVGAVTFALSLDKTIDKTMTADKAISYLVNMAQEQNVTLTTAETILLTVQLLDNYSNQKTVPTTTAFDVQVQQLQTNLLTKLLNATFSKTMEYLPTGQVDFQALVEFSTLLTTLFVADAAGETSGFVSFGVDLSQQSVNLGILTKSIEFNNLVDLLSIAGRDLTESLTITAQLDQDQTVDLTLEGFVQFQTFYNKLLGTQAIMRPSMDFDLQLLETSTANKNTLSSILLSLETDLIANGTRTLPGLIQFALQQTQDTELRLIADGRITLTSQLAESSALQLLGQRGITFGHLLGLSSFSGAVRGEGISFGTIQDFSVDGFVLQFTITTPDNRVLKIYFEDRTIIVDEEDREIKIYPDFRSDHTIN